MRAVGDSLQAHEQPVMTGVVGPGEYVEDTFADDARRGDLVLHIAELADDDPCARGTDGSFGDVLFEAGQEVTDVMCGEAEREQQAMCPPA
ncbi:hypothetical protein ACIRP2_20350 [Streptomyces sp. NPDC101194]|uniref:hypothetical protein n=1 Tax=Streptomyces sp. NPDC101194 TaxID=3366127 RepID=UPI0038119700